MLKNILRDIGYVCFINIMKSTRVFCMIQILIKDILRKVGNYPTYRIPYIIFREIGYIKNILRKVGNYPNWY